MDRARKRELRDLNERVWNGDNGIFRVGPSLDSSLKKNTAFIKRLRTAISSTALATFIQEIKTLSLHKYLSEIISACYEGLCRLKSPSDIDAGVEVVSALHQRFGPVEFTGNLAWLLGRGLATPDRSFLKTLSQEAREREEKDRLGRQRALLRVATELWLVRVLRTLDDVIRPDDAVKGAAAAAAAAGNKPAEGKSKAAFSAKAGSTEPFPLEVLKDLLGRDREHANLPLLVIFAKTYSWDILGAKPQKDARAEPGQGDVVVSAAQDDVDPPLTPPEIHEQFKAVLARYLGNVLARVVRDHKSLLEQGRRNAEAYVKSGEVFEDRQANYERQAKAQERLVANAQVIADVVGAEMPDLRGSEDAFGSAAGSIGLVRTGDYLRASGDGAGIWEDEDERRFYENLVDLKGKVPDILLEDGKKKKKGDQDDHQPSSSRKAEIQDAASDGAKPPTVSSPAVPLPLGPPSSPPPPVPPVVADAQSMAIANKTIGAQVDALLSQLPSLMTKDSIDQMAIDFCFLNSKASRNRLVKALTEVPKGRSDLLAPWSRLVATLGRYMPDMPKALVDHLDGEFRSLQRRKEKEFLGQVRLSNIRYLAELTKFGIVPEHVIFHCLKVCLDDFSRTNIDIMCNLLENCGRFLLRNPDTAPRMTSFLETLQRKKSVQHIGQQERMLIDNAVYYVDPPQRPAIVQKERTPMELFIRRLALSDLTRRNQAAILKRIRMLHWEEPEVVDILERVFSKPAHVRFGSTRALAGLLGGLYRYYPGFVVRVVDNVIESICLDLEQNDFRFYQRRLAEVRYLSEFYNYRILEHPVIFDTLYRIMTFGYGGAPPIPGRVNPFDPPDDFFRIRLATTILETCGVCFEQGASAIKLEYFLAFFQYYVFTKPSLPMDIDFLIHDTYALVRPQWKLATNLEEAAKAFQLAISKNQKTVPPPAEPEYEPSSASSEGEHGDEIADDDGADVGYGSVTDEDTADGPDADDGSSGEESGDEDEDEAVSRPHGMPDPDEEADFDREFSKMMSESLESRKPERKYVFDLALPARPRNRGPASPPAGSADAGSSGGGDKMAFSLLTRKGNRQQTRTVELPSDSDFAVSMRHQQQVEREEQQRIKNLVLNYDLREEDEGSDAHYPHPHNRQERQRVRGVNRGRRLQLSDVEWP